MNDKIFSFEVSLAILLLRLKKHGVAGTLLMKHSFDNVNNFIGRH